MDSTVIEEIAKQLGIAVDQAGQFITEQLPAFAAMKAMQAAVPLVIVGLLLLLSLVIMGVGAYVSFSNARAEKDRFKANREAMELGDRSVVYESNYKTSFTEYDSCYVFIFGFVAVCFFLILLMILSFILVPDLIGWSNYPEAMLIDMALKAV